MISGSSVPVCGGRRARTRCSLWGVFMSPTNQSLADEQINKLTLQASTSNSPVPPGEQVRETR